MKKLLLLTLSLSVLLFANGLIAQNFQEVMGTPFTGVTNGDMAFADVDGDNDQDVLITGRLASFQKIAELYINDGSGNYTLVAGTPFDGVNYSAIDFADIDGDNDQDVIITGYNGSSQYITKLYTNDGSGVFTLVAGTPFSGMWTGDVEFVDVDGDNDMDVIISGETASTQKKVELYTNNGSGIFTLVAGTPFVGVGLSTVTCADVDGDNDMDVLITGADMSMQRTSNLYTNDGSGVFTLVLGTVFEGVSDGSVAFADINSDTDLDVLITGSNGTTAVTKMYQNNGSGIFSLITINPFDSVSSSSIAFADIDNDNDMDVLISGYSVSVSTNNRIAKLYSNDGNGVFTEITGMPFDGVYMSSLAFADINGDTYADVLITGENNIGQLTSKLYTNFQCSAINGTDTRTECNPYVWIDGNTYTANNTTAKDTIVAGAANGCDSIVTLNLTITTVDTSVTQTGTDLTANELVATYQWLDCNNSYAVIPSATFRTYYATSNGSYAVAVTYYGCTDTSSCYTITGVSIDENTINNNITIYPNPVKDQLKITTENEKINSIKIMDVAGKMIKEFTQNITIINVANLPKGLYLVQIQTEKGIGVKRFIKE